MFARFVALGDSFTEGVGDDDSDYPNGVRGWADLVAATLAAANPALGYANLAVRGRLLDQVVAEQLEPALALGPDLVTLYAGGNDLMRPRPDIDGMAERYDDAVGRLAASGATVVLFTGVDGVDDPVFRKMRGRTAVYNEHVRLIAARHGAFVVDMWAMRVLRDRRMWSDDRIHLGPDGHLAVAKAVLDVLGACHTLKPVALPPAPARTAAERRNADLRWVRTHVLPWIRRRLTGTSSGDGISPKRPEPAPIAPH